MMVFKRAVQYISAFEKALSQVLFPRFPLEVIAPAVSNVPSIEKNRSKSQSLTEILKQSVLWAVPKKRRTIEKRRSRRFGWPDDVWKMIVPKKNILNCLKCGSYHQSGVLCPSCYKKIAEETTLMQEAIQCKLGISPVEEEVVVLYQGERCTDSEFYQGKRIVEMKKERPQIFSYNLLQRTTKTTSESTEVVAPTEVSQV